MTAGNLSLAASLLAIATNGGQGRREREEIKWRLQSMVRITTREFCSAIVAAFLRLVCKFLISRVDTTFFQQQIAASL